MSDHSCHENETFLAFLAKLFTRIRSFSMILDFAKLLAVLHGMDYLDLSIWRDFGACKKICLYTVPATKMPCHQCHVTLNWARILHHLYMTTQSFQWHGILIKWHGIKDTELQCWGNFHKKHLTHFLSFYTLPQTYALSYPRQVGRNIVIQEEEVWFFLHISYLMLLVEGSLGLLWVVTISFLPTIPYYPKPYFSSSPHNQAPMPSFKHPSN